MSTESKTMIEKHTPKPWLWEEKRDGLWHAEVAEGVLVGVSRPSWTPIDRLDRKHWHAWIVWKGLSRCGPYKDSLEDAQRDAERLFSEMSRDAERLLREAREQSRPRDCGGEARYFCGRCGKTKIAYIGQCQSCLKWAEANRIDRNRCGVCGNMADTFFVHGYRCREHFMQIEPSDMVLAGNGIILTGPRPP